MKTRGWMLLALWLSVLGPGAPLAEGGRAEQGSAMCAPDVLPAVREQLVRRELPKSNGAAAAVVRGLPDWIRANRDA